MILRYIYYYFLCILLLFHSKTCVLGALGSHFGTLGVHFGGLGLPRGLQGGPCGVRGRFFMDFGCPQGPCWGSLWDTFCTFSNFLVTELEIGLRTCFLCVLGWKSYLFEEAGCCKNTVNTMVFEGFHFLSESCIFDLSRSLLDVNLDGFGYLLEQLTRNNQ